MSYMKTCFGLGLAMAVSLGQPLFGRQEIKLPELHPNFARGSGDGMVLTGEGPLAINHFNGNATYQIPIGKRYPLTQSWDYQLVLHYNSNIWDFREVDDQNQALPMHASNAGMGFDLSLGRLLPPGTVVNPAGRWIWVSPDGGYHATYSVLHKGVTDIDDPADTTHYSRDGSYIRLRLISATEARVDLPDGRILYYEPGSGDIWRVYRMEHTFGGGWIDISYDTDGSWQITDSVGRSHSVTLTPDPTGTYPGLISQIDMAAVGGQRALYDFNYQMETLDRHCDDERGGTEHLPLLASITNPLGETAPFTYHTSGDCASQGRLATVQHPKGGTFDLTYGEYEFPSTSCGLAVPQHVLHNGGVVVRSNRLPDSSILGTWTFAPANFAQSGGTGACDWIRRATTVTTPSGDQHVYHFSIAAQDSSVGLVSEYGLPFTRAFTDSTGAFLSREIHDCQEGGTSCVPMRDIYETWDVSFRCTDLKGGCFDRNRRLTRARTIYLDDPLPSGEERYTQREYADFDGLGHYRMTIQSGNFNHEETWVEIIDSNPEAGSFPGAFTSPSVNAPWFLARATGTSRQQGTIQLPTQTQICVLPDGRVTRSRSLEGSAPGPHDLIEELVWNDGNVVERRQFGGDKQTLSSSPNLCDISLGTAYYRTAYTFQHGVLVTAAALDANGQEIPGKLIDKSIDLNTGLPLVERDVSGIATNYGYDLLGRRTQVRPEEGHGPWKLTWYRPPITGSGWSAGHLARDTWVPNGATSSPVLRREYRWFGFFGKVVGEQLQLPSNRVTNNRSRIVRRFDAEGRLLWEFPRYLPGGPPVHKNRFEDYDPLGRPRRIVAPDGHVKTITYLGAREKRTVVTHGTNYSNGTCVEQDGTITVTRDSRGRVILEKNEQPWPLPGLTVEREFTYDVDNRRTATTRRTTIGQTTRTYAQGKQWDRRGLLLTSSKTNAQSLVIHRRELGEYDAGGLAHWQRYTDRSRPYPGLETIHVYDKAQRLLQIKDATDPNKLWKTFSYGMDNGTGADPDYRLGRMVASTRFNYHPDRHIRIVNSYVYGGPGGQVSEKEMEARWGNQILKRYTTQTAYDALGLPRHLIYPDCDNCSTGEPTLTRAVTIERALGFDLSVSGQLNGSPESWIDEIVTGPGLSPQEVVHANGVTDIYHSDPFVFSRKGRIEVTGTFVNEDSGTYVYDGRGDTCGVGEQSTVAFRKEPTVSSGSSSCLQTVLSDPFGQASGETAANGCSHHVNLPILIFDAQDRLVHKIDRSAKKRVFVAGTGWTWLADPDNWKETWYLHGTDGRLLRTVDDSYLGRNWLTTTDSITAARTNIRVTHEAGGTVKTEHSHPIGGLRTDATGRPVQ